MVSSTPISNLLALRGVLNNYQNVSVEIGGGIMAAVYSGVRESRPDNYTDVGTTSGAILRDFGGECLKHAERSFAMGIQCQQLSALQALMSMEDAVIISHSPQGCLGCSGFAADNYRWGQAMRGVKQVKNPRIFLTNLDQKSVIFGGEKKLRQTIALAEERYP